MYIHGDGLETPHDCNRICHKRVETLVHIIDNFKTNVLSVQTFIRKSIDKMSQCKLLLYFVLSIFFTPTQFSPTQFCVISFCCKNQIVRLTEARKYVHMYDTSSTHYKDCQMATNKWEEISTNINLVIPECRNV